MYLVASQTPLRAPYPRQKHSTAKQLHAHSHHSRGGREHCKPHAPNRLEWRYQINSARRTLRCHWTPSNACWGPSPHQVLILGQNAIPLSAGFWKQFCQAFSCSSSDPDPDIIACSPYSTPTRTQISAKISSPTDILIWVCTVGAGDV